MPEGDTVWHTATILRDALAGKTLTRCDVRVPKFATVDLTGQVVDEVISRGKHLFIRVGDASIHSHLKMDGSWQVNPVSKPSRAGHRIRIILEADDIQAAGIDLGVLEVLEREHDMEAVAHLGPDLLGDDWDPHIAVANLTADLDRPLAATLLDQRVMAGVGNVYCNELCFVTGHLPTAPVTRRQGPAADGAAGPGHVVAQPLSVESYHDRRHPARPRAVGLRPHRAQPCRRCGTADRVRRQRGPRHLLVPGLSDVRATPA